MNKINILEYLTLKELGIMEHNMFMAGTPLCMDKKSKEKQINITFEEMQERRLKRTLDEIESTSKRIEDRLSCEEATEKVCPFVIEQEDLMKEKGIKFERIYNNGKFAGWRIEAETLQYKAEQGKLTQGWKDIMDKVNEKSIAFEFLDYNYPSLLELASLLSDFDKEKTLHYDFEKEEKDLRRFKKDLSKTSIVEKMKPLQHKTNMTMEEACKQMQDIAEENGVLPINSKYQTADEIHSEMKGQTLEKMVEILKTVETCPNYPATYKLDIVDKSKGAKLDDSKAGIKESDGKLDYELDWNFIEQMAQRMSQNKGKYPPNNWKRLMDVEKLKQSLLRHTMEIMKGNYSDDGREFGHFESIALNSMMINYQLQNPQTKHKQEDFINK